MTFFTLVLEVNLKIMVQQLEDVAVNFEENTVSHLMEVPLCLGKSNS